MGLLVSCLFVICDFGPWNIWCKVWKSWKWTWNLKRNHHCFWGAMFVVGKVGGKTKQTVIWHDLLVLHMFSESGIDISVSHIQLRQTSWFRLAAYLRAPCSWNTSMLFPSIYIRCNLPDEQTKETFPTKTFPKKQKHTPLKFKMTPWKIQGLC